MIFGTPEKFTPPQIPNTVWYFDPRFNIYHSLAFMDKELVITEDAIH
jgi:hypothetical protein